MRYIGLYYTETVNPVTEDVECVVNGVSGLFVKYLANIFIGGIEIDAVSQFDCSKYCCQPGVWINLLE